MSEEGTQYEEIEHGEADDAVVNDIPPVEEDGLGQSTPSSRQPSSEDIAALPEVQEAFRRAFAGNNDKGEGGDDSGGKAEARTQATRRRQQPRQEQADELEGLGADELDDGVEPDDDAEPADDPDEREETEPTQRRDEGKQEAEETTLHPVLRHAAKRAGWDDADIDGLVKADPELADKTFHRLLKSFNDLSAQYGQLGAARGGMETPPTPRPTQQGRTGDPLEALYGPDKLQELREKYGEDFMDDILKPALGPVMQMQELAARQELEAVGNEIGQFFRGLPKEFGELYGSGTKVSVEQFEARQELAQQADQIREGALRQGIRLSVSECLERANLMFASEHVSTLERKKITRQVQERSRQITHRPTHRTTLPRGEKQSFNAAQEAYAQRAAELGLELSE